MTRRRELVLAGMACLAMLGCVAPAEPDGGVVELDPDAGWIEGADGVAVRAVWAPANHWILDMNSRGDLLLATVEQPSEGRWLLIAAPRTRGRGLAPAASRYQKPAFLPFSGRSLNERGEVLGPGTKLFRRGAVVELPDPCPAEIRNGMTVDCYTKPVQGFALADNGDVPVSFRKDYIWTLYSPYWQLRVWRAAAGEWVTLLELSGESLDILPAVSPGGLVAAVFPHDGNPTLPPVVILIAPAGPGGGLDVAGMCPGLYADPGDVRPVAVNDAGDLVAQVTCYDGSAQGARMSVYWRRDQPPVFLDGVGKFVDESGNVLGERAADGHSVVWMTDGSVKDLSAVVASAGPVVLKKVLPGHQVFGTVERRGVVWRY